MDTRGEQAECRVLVVDDDAALRNVIRFNLQRAGFDVVTGGNGLEGWARLERQTIDMVVADLQMPRMDGLELCQKMRSDERFAGVPVLMLTAKGLEIDTERLKSELGIVDIMFKPFSPKQLVRTVALQLGQTAADKP